MNEAVAKVELVGIRWGPDCGYDPNVTMEDIDKSLQRRENRSTHWKVYEPG